jgi:DNA polymerase
LKSHADFETRSAADLKKVGLYAYARHATTDIICLSYGMGDEEPKLWHPGMDMAVLDRLFDHVRAGGAFYAHNVWFEYEIWNEVGVKKYGFPPLKEEQCYCTMAMAYAMGLPGALEDAALSMGLHLQKDMAGRALILRMCRPRKVNDDGSIIWWTDADKLERAYEYCKQDVRVERELAHRLFPLSEKERRVWLLDHRINARGVFVDRASAIAGSKMAEETKERCNQELAVLTGGEAKTVSALIPLKGWLARHGVAVDSLAKRDLADLLDDQSIRGAPRRALELRQEAGKASTAKLDKMLNLMWTDDRIRYMYQYHGAGPGRFAGRGLQPHNMVRDMRKHHEVEQVLQMVREGDHEMIEALFGPPLSEISRALRSFFCAPAGRVIVGGDFANVEGRGQAWFAGEQWKLDAFVAADEKRGPGLYELAYSRMFSVPVESVKNPSEERQVGKVSELAFGYQGGVGSFHTMGKNYNVTVSDAKAEEFKQLWRAAHPKIVKTWYDIQRAAMMALRNPGTAFTCGYPGREATFKVVGSFCWLLLPSGRVICYPYPKILEGDFGPQFTYMTVPDPQARKKGKVIDDKMNSGNFVRVGAYGGSFFNNIVQGFSRDLLTDCMLEADARDAEIVLHTHDDANVEVDEARAQNAQRLLTQLMNTPPAWAKGLPLKADVHIMKRYGK